ncbi:LIC12628 family protein [Leptospira ainazelensis]|uniref:LIC12628 family protein n=1 Tax=Leptospira ainazelensis TaxID=2810034 RepID=UPI0019635BEE|nr:hypothetical protein [Leptospira ainazelensis]
MIISWDKIRHQHPKEEWKELLGQVDSFVEEGSRGSSRIFFERTLRKNKGVPTFTDIRSCCGNEPLRSICLTLKRE